MLTCDRCDSTTRAQWRARHDQHEILFCAHCAAKNRPALIEQGWLLSLLPGHAASAPASCARA